MPFFVGSYLDQHRFGPVYVPAQNRRKVGRNGIGNAYLAKRRIAIDAVERHRRRQRTHCAIRECGQRGSCGRRRRRSLARLRPGKVRFGDASIWKGRNFAGVLAAFPPPKEGFIVRARARHPCVAHQKRLGECETRAPRAHTMKTARLIVPNNQLACRSPQLPACTKSAPDCTSCNLPPPARHRPAPQHRWTPSSSRESRCRRSPQRRA